MVTGGHVTYGWDLGDGTEDEGASVEHVYPRIGVFTATVTAENSFGTATAATVVTISPSRFDLQLPLLYRGWGGSMPSVARR